MDLSIQPDYRAYHPPHPTTTNNRNNSHINLNSNTAARLMLPNRPRSSSSAPTSTSSSSSSSTDSDSDSHSTRHSHHHHRHRRARSHSIAASSIYSKPPSSPQDSFDQLIYSADPFAHLRLTEFNAQSLIRHGFDDPSENPDYLDSVSKSHQSYWDQSPYKNITPSDLVQIPHWTQPPKHRTACAALFLCLRLGFDPPDIVKASPAPTLEAWTDPKQLPKETVLDTISKRLQQQFESLAPTHARVKFKTYGDVYAEEFKKTLLGLRKYSRYDRCLVYYNGHGVPKPTPTGEIWVFNKAYTQYIPIRLFDILTWVGSPAVFIWDCNNAGQILNHLLFAAIQKDEENMVLGREAAMALRQAILATYANLNPTARSADPAHPVPASSSQLPTTTNNTSTSPSVSKKPSANQLQEPGDPSSTKCPHFTSETIQLAACQPDEMLPRDPKLPADVFTSCLTSPIEMALRFYVLRNNSQRSQWTSTAEFFQDLGKLDKVPGRMEMRRTPLGELTWIFTSIADAIAWNHLDRQTFTKIFRGDLVLAGTFRGFLLAERVMKAYGCTPMSTPKLPATHHSELWHTWDLEVDMCLSQLPGIWKSEEARAAYEKNKQNYPPNSLPPQIVPYMPSTFFSQQLTAFEVWLKFVVAENQDESGEKDEDLMKRRESLQWSCNNWSDVNINQVEITDFSCSNPNSQTSPKDKRASVKVNGKTPHLAGKSSGSHASPASGAPKAAKIPEQQPAERPIRYKLPTHIKHFPLNSRKGDDIYPPSPPQLPIVLQVLLSPVHRLRALILLCRLMDLGPWAVHLSLSIGIFQYVLKLLQAPAADLKPVLIFIWARILTVYPEGRQDLMRVASRPHARPEGPIEYFIKIMAPNSMELPIVNVVDHKAMCAFILSITCQNSRGNSLALMQFGVLDIIIYRIKELVPWQRQWYLILLAHMWEESDLVKGRAIKMGINTLLSDLLTDKVPEVRTAALYAFGTLIGVSTNPKQLVIEDQFPIIPGQTEERQPESSSSRPQNKSNLSVYQTNKLSSLSSSNPDLTVLGYQEQVSIEVGSAMACCHCSTDGSPMFRQELVVVLSALVDQHLGHFIVAAFEFIKQQEQEKSMKINKLIQKYQADRQQKSSSKQTALGADESHMMTDRTAKLEKLINKLKADEEVHPKESLRAYLWMEYTSIYIVLLDLSLDPSEQVARPAKVVVDYIHSRLLDSVLGKLLELGDLSYGEAPGGGVDGTGQLSETPLGRLGNHSHSNLIASSFASTSSNPTGREPKSSNQSLVNRSSTSVFHSLSTVNNLVPNFVKSSGWKTPFNSLSRSPEQAVFNSNDPVASTLTQSPQDLNKSASGLRKSASVNPIINVELDSPQSSQPSKMPLNHNGFSHASSTSSSQTQCSTEDDRHLQGLSTNQSIESIIAHTRASDHTRRQRNRSYPLQPAFPSAASPSYQPGKMNASTSTTSPVANPSHQEDGEEENYLYYLGLHNLEKLKAELNSRPEPSERQTMLPLMSDYYRLSSHIFLKPKMTSSGGESESESSDSDNNDDHDNDQPQVFNEKAEYTEQRPPTHQSHHPRAPNHQNTVVDDAALSHISHPHHFHPPHHHHIDAGSLENIKDSWRKQRNLRVILDGPTLKSNPGPNNWDHLVCSFNHSKPINNLLMHQFEDQLITSDSSGYITVYDWRSKSILNRFQPSDDPLDRITSMQLINQENVALLLASTPDGNVRIFRDYERPGKLAMVTAFKGLPNNEPSSLGESGSVTDWQQSTGLLLVGGNSRDIKVWNSRRERCVEDIKTRSNSCLTSLSSDHHSGWMIAAGFGDGSVRMFDRRKPPKNSMVKVFRSVHSSWCSTIKLQAGHRRELFSADSTGLIAQWDLRFDSPLRTFLAHEEGMPAFDLHDHAPILASGSMNGSVKIWNLDNGNDENDEEFTVERAPRVLFNLRNLYESTDAQDPQGSNTISGLPSTSITSPLMGDYGHRLRGIGIGNPIRDALSSLQPITGLCFHPHRAMISITDGNGKLNIYSTDIKL
ncbi:hypothetical protein PGTUg99_019325 [Puccinia graminis f. sp. tritici]|uniref:Raptor N-terminal CASPase-like domain-containing protein n=1 Tax=Puccinia graminis f. sp. tritici TaxID=56615 RepID=A0A5B0RIR4_PUCGR|nr:hypothetical protein PGTUg99_019325 [Puccinia graminis f. sp. tritici]